jgi:dienelactone hydrolase
MRALADRRSMLRWLSESMMSSQGEGAVAQSHEWSYHGSRGTLVARSWSGPGEPTHVVVIADGYGEHIGRYEQLADALVANGAVVYAVDHVGHGKSEGSVFSSRTSRMSSPTSMHWTKRPAANILIYRWCSSVTRWAA